MTTGDTGDFLVSCTFAGIAGRILGPVEVAGKIDVFWGID